MVKLFQYSYVRVIMGTETEFTYATKASSVGLDLTGKTATLNRQGYVPNTGDNGFRVHFNYSRLFNVGLMHLSMNGKNDLAIEIPDPMNPDGFDMGALMEQEGFFRRSSRIRPEGELIIGQLSDGRKSEMRSIVSPYEPGRASIGIKVDLIDPATGLIDATSRSEHERKGIDDKLAARVLDDFCRGRELQKAFYDLLDQPQAGIHCYLQEFKSRAHRGLVLAEFEMSRSAAETFKPPSWLKNAFDVTSVPDFRTKALAVGGGMWRSVFNRLAKIGSHIARQATPAWTPELSS